MQINRTEEHGIVILAPDGRVDSNTASLLEQAIDKIGTGDDGFHVLIDFSNIDYISSAGLRVVLKAVKERQAGPKSFATSGMQDHVREIFEISGFDAFIPIHKDTEQAIQSFS